MFSCLLFSQKRVEEFDQLEEKAIIKGRGGGDVPMSSLALSRQYLMMERWFTVRTGLRLPWEETEFLKNGKM